MPIPKPRFEKDADGITRMIVPSRLNYMNDDGLFCTEQYNPEIHCCRDWSKDYCECVKEKMKLAKRKSQSQRLRNVLYKVWQQDGEGEFKEYYRHQTERIIEHFKNKLDADT